MKFLINPDKYIYDSKLLAEFNKLKDVIVNLCTTVPDKDWNDMDSDALLKLIPKLLNMAKELTKTRIKR